MTDRTTVASSESIGSEERGVLRPPSYSSSFDSGGLHGDGAVLDTATEALIPTLDHDGQTSGSHLVGVHTGVRVHQANIRTRDAASERIELVVGAVAVQVNIDGGDERRTELVAILHSEISEKVNTRAALAGVVGG
jgi:hypothetical protein